MSSRMVRTRKESGLQGGKLYRKRRGADTSLVFGTHIFGWAGKGGIHYTNTPGVYYMLGWGWVFFGWGFSLLWVRA